MTVLDMFRLDGKVALVTGGAGLYGRQIVAALAEAGAKTFIAARDVAKLEAVAGDERAQGRDVTALSLDLSSVEPSLAGPKRPQDRVPLGQMKQSFRTALRAPIAERGFALDDAALARTGTIAANGHSVELHHGAVVIAAITSCTNTSNPSVMLAAGLLAKKAVEKGLRVKPYVKTSLAPGSRVVTEGGDRLDDGTTVAVQGDPPPPGGVAANAPASAAARKVTPPTAEQRQRILDSAAGDPEKLAQRQAFLAAIDRGEPEALERWQQMSQRRRRGPDGGGP